MGEKDPVLKSASVTAEQAVELQVVDLLADDMPDLLRQLDGREVDRQIMTTGRPGVGIPMAGENGSSNCSGDRK